MWLYSLVCVGPGQKPRRHNEAHLPFTFSLNFQHGFDSELLGNIFSLGILGNSLVAICAGIVAQWFADQFGFV